MALRRAFCAFTAAFMLLGALAPCRGDIRNAANAAKSGEAQSLTENSSSMKVYCPEEAFSSFKAPQLCFFEKKSLAAALLTTAAVGIQSAGVLFDLRIEGTHPVARRILRAIKRRAP